MPKNDLDKPLMGLLMPEAPAVRRRSVIAPLIVSVAIVVAVIAAIWVAVVDDPDGGRPVAAARISDPIPAATGSIDASGAPAAGADGTSTEVAIATPPQLELQPQPQQPEPPADEIQLAGLPQLPAAVSGDPSLLEQTSLGALPRISPDGRKPRDTYARRAAPVPQGVPRIVLVVGGLGISQTGTQAAIDALPEDVTLAFAPYGSSLERWVGKAREKGHEVLLQIPLEPLDHAQTNDAGDHTLLVEGGPANRENLHWALARMTSYAGVMNHMGGRFLEDEHAVVPFLGEIGERGLFYLDDGSAQDSLAGRIGAALKVPVVTADKTIDRIRTPSAIEKELAGLETMARTRGLAVGVASAFPASIEVISRWVREAQARGIVVIPASAAYPS